MQTSAVNIREYNKIYTGTNQENGYETPFLGFKSDTIELVLKKDKVTYFHYPISAPSGLLIDSSLVQDGAIAGQNPYSSDKIWKKQANYFTNSIWGNSQPTGKQTGVWLCSWLSGNSSDENTTPIWKDRWYNPGYIDSTTAMFITNPVASSILVDIDSEMSFEGGSYYKYYHIGNSHNSTLINSLTTENHLKLYLETWSETPEDLSYNNNVTKIENFSNECVNYEGINSIEYPLDDCLKIHATNYCETLYNSSIALTGNLSYNIWAYCDDWNKGNNTILSKDNRGGYSLRYDNGFNNPFMFFVENNGNIILMNTDGLVINSKTLPQPSNPVDLVVDFNNFTWIADNDSKKIYKIDYNSDILDSINFDNSVELASIALDNNKLLWALDSNSSTISSFDIFTNKVSTTSILPVGYNMFTFDLNNNIQSTSGSQILIDNDNNIWEVKNNFVYKNSTEVISGNFIACDKDNNIWVLFDTNSFLKMDNTTFDYVSGAIGNNTNNVNRTLNFSYEFVNDEWQTFAYFTYENEQKIYKTDKNGNYIKSIDISIFDTIPMLENINSYDWNRKFNYCKHDRTPQIKADIFIRNNNEIEKHVLSTPIDGFNDKNWHMFTFTYDRNNINFYMDSILRDNKIVGNNTNIYYKYENSLILGTDVGKSEPFKKELKYNSYSFNGKIDALRIYDSILNNFNIRNLYLDKYKFTDLVWNIPTGNQNYIEEIVRFFKFKLPGQKSQYYNINLIGLQIEDENLKIIIENIIKDTIKKVAPAYAELYKIIWK
jgi:hypothetical protein